MSKLDFLKSNKMIICTPSGYCPEPLEGFEPQHIEDWLTRLDKRFANDPKYHYSIEAIQYWIRDFVDVNSPIRKEIANYIEEVKSEYSFFDNKLLVIKDRINQPSLSEEDLEDEMQQMFN